MTKLQSRSLILVVISLILIIFVAIYYLNKNTENNGKSEINDNEKGSEITDEYVVSDIQKEIDDIKQVEVDNLPTESKFFDLEVVTRDFSDGRVDFEVNIFNPKANMNQVKISAFLGDKILNHLNTPVALVTNVLAVLNSENDDTSSIFNIGPNSEIKGITTSANMIYFEEENLENVLEDIPYIIIKVSWNDEKDSEKLEYLKYPTDHIIIKLEK